MTDSQTDILSREPSPVPVSHLTSPPLRPLFTEGWFQGCVHYNSLSLAFETSHKLFTSYFLHSLSLLASPTPTRAFSYSNDSSGAVKKKLVVQTGGSSCEEVGSEQPKLMY
eukprot:scaffold2695_cov142-Isochrysis_galbana.AAC.5